MNLNDGDAAIWSTAYGLSAALCSAAAFDTSSKSRALSNVAALGSAAALLLSAYSFAQLRGVKTSGLSGIFSVFEIEAVREGGGALIMAASLWLCARTAGGQSPTSGASMIAPIVAVSAVALGLFLPRYYTHLGVPIAEHCGGSGQ